MYTNYGMKDNYEEIKEEVLEVFKTILNESMALDACGIQGKLRAMILADQEFVTKARAIRAKAYIKEIQKINKLEEKAASLSEDEFDVRAGKAGSDKKYDKESITLQHRLTEARRNLLSISSEDQNEEQNALNIFFIPLSAEEFRAMEQTEINEGTGDGMSALQEATTENPLGSAKGEEEILARKEDLPLYSEDAEGNIIEI